MQYEFATIYWSEPPTLNAGDWIYSSDLNSDLFKVFVLFLTGKQFALDKINEIQT
jgi:hypothetical protein